MSPSGLSDDTNRDSTQLGNASLHTVGRWSWAKYTPPMPYPLASWAPTTRGWSGMISASLVGRFARSLTRRSKEARCCRTALVTLTRPLSEWVRASWSMQKRPLLPGIPIETNRSSPSRLIQVFLLTRLRPFRSLNRASKRSFRWSGSSMVLRTASTSHPSITFAEFQDPSFTSLDRDRGSLNLSPLEVGALRTSSMACMRMRRMVFNLYSVPWATTRKSSTKTSV